MLKLAILGIVSLSIFGQSYPPAGGGGATLPTATATGQIPATNAIGAGTVAYPPKLQEDMVNNNLLLGTATDAKNATWVLMSMGRIGTNNYTHLIISYSNDGTTWYYIDTGFNGTGNVSDVTWTKINGRYWTMFTQNAPANLGLAYSDDLVTWTQLADVAVTGTFGTCTNQCMDQANWAPEFYQDPADGASSGKYHVFYSSGSSAGLFPHNIYHVLGTYNYSTQTWTWTNEAGTSNAADLIVDARGAGASTIVSAIDPFVIKIGSTYNLLGAIGNSQTSTCVANANCGVQLWTSTSVASGYTLQTSTWSGQLPANTGYSSEAPELVVHGVDGSGNPLVRMYWMKVPNQNGMFYTQASMTGGNLNTLTWGTPVQVTALGTGSGSANLFTNLNHGTQKVDNSVETMRDLLNATAQQVSKTFGSITGPLCIGCVTPTNTTSVLETSGGILHVKEPNATNAVLIDSTSSAQASIAFVQNGNFGTSYYVGQNQGGSNDFFMFSGTNGYSFFFYQGTCLAIGANANAVTCPTGVNHVDIGVTEATSAFQVAPVLVSALGTCNAAAKGQLKTVSDATSPTYLGTLTGGGTVYTPVTCNGTAWVSH